MGRLLLACLMLFAGPAVAETVRVAVYNVELHRDGPGLLLRDIWKGDEQAQAVAKVIAHVAPDVILLLRVDYDRDGLALLALADLVAGAGQDYPHRFALRPNTGRLAGVDLNGDGKISLPDDGQGWGQFAGHNGMALLSKFPIRTDGVREFSDFLWADLPEADLPVTPDGAPYLPQEVLAVQRLSTVGHWEVPVETPTGVLRLLAYHATPPVFDGPEDRNGRRGGDETRFWTHLLDGHLPFAPPKPPFVILGGSNIDPGKGDGRRDAMQDLLAHPQVQDPLPGQDTVDWSGVVDPAHMRVDYVLPDAALTVTGQGIFWPEPGDPAHAFLGEDGRGASRHRLVWVDLALPDPASSGFLDPDGTSR